MSLASAFEAMEPYFAQAQTNGWWFRSHYDRVWFTPQELREAMLSGRFLWGPENWVMMDPRQELHEIGARIVKENEAYNRWLKRLSDAGVHL